MTAVVDKVDKESIDFLEESTFFWFQLPVSSLHFPVREGDRLEIEFRKIKPVSDEEDYPTGGYIKNIKTPELV